MLPGVMCRSGMAQGTGSTTFTPPVAAQRHLGTARHPAPGSGRCEGSDHLGCERRLHRLSGAPARRRGVEKGDLQKGPPGGIAVEAADHGLGRSRGGLSTKIHLAVEQGQKPLSVLITAGRFLRTE